MFENLSLSVKRERHQASGDTLRDHEKLSEQVMVAEKQTTLYEVFSSVCEPSNLQDFLQSAAYKLFYVCM